MWHAIIAFGQHTRSNDVGRGMPTWPLDSRHGRTMSSVACHHSPWTANRVERRWAWHAIIAFKLADTVGRCRSWHAIISHGRQTRSNDVGGGMLSPPLDSTHSRTTSGVASIICFGQHMRSDGFGRGMPSSPLDSTNYRSSSGMVCHHSPWTTHTVGNVVRGITLPPLERTQPATSGVA